LDPDPGAGTPLHENSHPAMLACVLEPSERPVFVGREHELTQLSAALSAARRGHGSLCLIVGERGVGKTTLADRLCKSAREQGIHVATGYGRDAGGAPAYWPWIQVLRALARARPDGEQLVLGRGAADVVGLVPEIAHRLVPNGGTSPARDPDQRRFELFDAVGEFLAAMTAVSAAVLVLENLHAADEGSLLLLSFLARQLHDTSLLIVGTHVDVDVSPPPAVARLLEDLARDGSRLPLRGLSDEAVAKLIAVRTGAPVDVELLATIQRLTAGHPFFVNEIVRVLAAEGQLSAHALTPEQLPLPDSVRVALERRLDPLDADCRALLQAAAIAGEHFSITRLAASVGIEPADALARLEPAERLQLVRELPDALGRYAFAHALVRETLLRDLTDEQRRELHRHVVEAIERRHAGTLDDHLPALAYHSIEALPLVGPAKAADYNRRAGERAARQLAYEEAARYFRQALDLEQGRPEERCELLLALGSAQRRSGRVGTARASFEEAATLARELAAPRLLAHSALGYAGALGGPAMPAPTDPVVVTTLEEALHALGPEPSPERAQLLARLALELYYTPDVERRRELSQQAVETADATGDPRSRLIARYSFCWSTLGPDRPEDRHRAADELLELASGSDDLEMRFSARHFRVANCLERGDLAGVDAELAACDRLAETLRQPLYRWQAALLRAMRALLQGRAEDSEQFALEAFEAGQIVDVEAATALLSAQLFNHRWVVGRLDELTGWIDEFVSQRPFAPAWACACALLFSEVGWLETAREKLDIVGANGFKDLPRDGNWAVAVASAGFAASTLAAREHAAALYELAAPVADRVVVIAAGDSTIGPMALYAGALAATLGRWDEALAHFDEADRVTARLDARPVAAFTHRERARMLIARGGDGDLAAAAEQCRGALALARALGMERLAEQARELLDGLPAGDRNGVADDARPPRVALLERTGDAWRVGYEPRVTLLRHSKGMSQLATLLADPGVAFAAVDLVRCDGGEPTDAERARVNVTRALRGAIRRIAAHDPELGRELGEAIRTGTAPRYEPRPLDRTYWRVSR
jgi:tetratricopeptide (TPR) repeat protein